MSGKYSAILRTLCNPSIFKTLQSVIQNFRTAPRIFKKEHFWHSFTQKYLKITLFLEKGTLLSNNLRGSIRLPDANSFWIVPCPDIFRAEVYSEPWDTQNLMQIQNTVKHLRRNIALKLLTAMVVFANYNYFCNTSFSHSLLFFNSIKVYL